MSRGNINYLKNITPEQRKLMQEKAKETRRLMKENPELVLRKLSPLKAIREKCRDCSNNSTDEIKECPIKTCSLWIYRFGKRPAGAPTDDPNDVDSISEDTDETLDGMTDGISEKEPKVIEVKQMDEEKSSKLDEIIDCDLS